MGVTHTVRTKSGDSYTDRGGVEKESFITVGRMIENSKGNKMIVIDAMPFAWFGAGKPVVLYLQAVEAKDRPATTPAAATPKQGDIEDDIPF